MSDCALTILILCRNEEGSIAHCVGEAREFLERNAIAGEVLVVDNGSSDRSAVRAAAAGARVAAEAQPGYGNAIRAGIAAARGRFIILGDGDGEHDLSALDAFWEKLQGGCDLVVGNRFAGAMPAGAMPLLNRYVGAPLLSGIGKRLSGAPVGDFHCGLRGFRAAGIRALALQSPGMELASEMVVKAVLKGLRIAETPVTQRRALDPGRASHLRIWADGWRHLRLMLMLSPRWLFFYPAGFLLAAGALLMALPAAWPVAAGGRFGAYTMLFGAAFVICGAQLVGFALLAGVFYETVGLSAGGLAAKVRRHRALEKGLAVGFTLALAGAAGSVWSLFVWAEGVDLETRLRIAVPAATLLMLGVQVMFSGFLLTLLATYAGAKVGGGEVNRNDGAVWGRAAVAGCPAPGGAV